MASPSATATTGTGAARMLPRAPLSMSSSVPLPCAGTVSSAVPRAARKKRGRDDSEFLDSDVDSGAGGGASASELSPWSIEYEPASLRAPSVPTMRDVTFTYLWGQKVYRPASGPLAALPSLRWLAKNFSPKVLQAGPKCKLVCRLMLRLEQIVVSGHGSWDNAFEPHRTNYYEILREKFISRPMYVAPSYEMLVEGIPEGLERMRLDRAVAARRKQGNQATPRTQGSQRNQVTQATRDAVEHITFDEPSANDENASSSPVTPAAAAAPAPAVSAPARIPTPPKLPQVPPLPPSTIRTPASAPASASASASAPAATPTSAAASKSLISLDSFDALGAQVNDADVVSASNRSVHVQLHRQAHTQAVHPEVQEVTVLRSRYEVDPQLSIGEFSRLMAVLTLNKQTRAAPHQRSAWDGVITNLYSDSAFRPKVDVKSVLGISVDASRAPKWRNGRTLRRTYFMVQSLFVQAYHKWLDACTALSQANSEASAAAIPFSRFVNAVTMSTHLSPLGCMACVMFVVLRCGREDQLTEMIQHKVNSGGSVMAVALAATNNCTQGNVIAPRRKALKRRKMTQSELRAGVVDASTVIDTARLGAQSQAQAQQLGAAAANAARNRNRNQQNNNLKRPRAHPTSTQTEQQPVSAPVQREQTEEDQQQQSTSQNTIALARQQQSDAHRTAEAPAHARAQTAQAQVEARARAHVRAQAEARILARAEAQAQAQAHARSQAHAHAQSQAQAQAHAHAHAHAQAQQAQAHAHAHAQAQVQAQQHPPQSECCRKAVDECVRTIAESAVSAAVYAALQAQHAVIDVPNEISKLSKLYAIKSQLQTDDHHAILKYVDTEIQTIRKKIELHQIPNKLPTE